MTIDTEEKPNGDAKPPRPKLVTIYVNTRKHQVDEGDITFEEVVRLGYPDTPPAGASGYTVLYQRAHGNKDGALVAGQRVKVKEGMTFDVTPTTLS